MSRTPKGKRAQSSLKARQKSLEQERARLAQRYQEALQKAGALTEAREYWYYDPPTLKLPGEKSALRDTRVYKQALTKEIRAQRALTQALEALWEAEAARNRAKEAIGEIDLKTADDQTVAHAVWALIEAERSIESRRKIADAAQIEHNEVATARRCLEHEHRMKGLAAEEALVKEARAARAALARFEARHFLDLPQVSLIGAVAGDKASS